MDDDFTQSTVKLFGDIVQLYGTANLSQQRRRRVIKVKLQMSI